MRRPVSRDEAGFTLVEVVVAFAIVTLVLASLYHALAGVYHGEARAQVRDRALAHARAHLEKIGIEQRLEAGETTGSYGEGLPWRLTIANSDALAHRGQAFRIVLEALDHSGHPMVRLETFKLRPRPQEER